MVNLSSSGYFIPSSSTPFSSTSSSSTSSSSTSSSSSIVQEIEFGRACRRRRLDRLQLLDLPKVLFDKIFSYLSLLKITKIRCVNRLFRARLTSCENHFPLSLQDQIRSFKAVDLLTVSSFLYSCRIKEINAFFAQCHSLTTLNLSGEIDYSSLVVPGYNYSFFWTPIENNPEVRDLAIEIYSHITSHLPEILHLCPSITALNVGPITRREEEDCFGTEFLRTVCANYDETTQQRVKAFTLPLYDAEFGIQDLRMFQTHFKNLTALNLESREDDYYTLNRGLQHLSFKSWTLKDGDALLANCPHLVEFSPTSSFPCKVSYRMRADFFRNFSVKKIATHEPITQQEMDILADSQREITEFIIGNYLFKTWPSFLRLLNNNPNLRVLKILIEDMRDIEQEYEMIEVVGNSCPNLETIHVVQAERDELRINPTQNKNRLIKCFTQCQKITEMVFDNCFSLIFEEPECLSKMIELRKLRIFFIRLSPSYGSSASLCIATLSDAVHRMATTCLNLENIAISRPNTPIDLTLLGSSPLIKGLDPSWRILRSVDHHFQMKRNID